MKINKFFATALVAAMALTSCSNSDSVTPENPETGDETFAGFSFAIPADMVSKAEDSSVGTTPEKAINKIGIYIWDQGGNTFHSEVREFNTTNFTKTPGSGNNPDVYTAKFGVKTTTGTKKVFVVANPSANVAAALASKRGATLNDVGFGLPQTDFVGASDMVLSGQYKDALNSDEINLGKVDETAAIAAAKEVDIYRNLSKVVLEKGAPGKFDIVGGTTNLKYTVVARAKDAYFLPQGSSTLFSAVPSGAAGDPTHVYFNNFTPISGIADSEFKTIEENGQGKTSANGFYAFENLPNTFLGGNTTTILIKGQFTPTTVVTSYTEGGARTTATGTSGQDFFKCLKDGTFWTQAGVTSAIGKDGYLNTDFVKYTGGVGYYTVPVQDSDKAWGVKRNNYYVIEVESVNGPGSPEQPTNPETPLNEDSYLSIKAKVHHWDFQNTQVDIQ